MTQTALELLIEKGVTTVRLAYPDVHGIARGKEFPARYFANLMHEGAPHCEAIMTVDLQHNVTSGSSTASRTSWPGRSSRRCRSCRGIPRWRG